MGVNNSLSDIISSERIARGWSQRELATRAHVSKSSISRVERGYVLAYDQILSILDALGMKIEIKRNGGIIW